MDGFLQNEQVVMTAEDKKKFWDTLCELKGEDTDRDRLLQTIKYPRFLYRYRPISIRSLAALSENKMYFSTSNYYDDPFDTFLRIDVKKIESEMKASLERAKDDKELVKNIASLLGNPNINIPEKLNRNVIEYIDNILKIAFCNVRNELRKEVFSVCFSDLWNNETLWIKYADQHKGYAIIYDLTDEDKLICGTPKGRANCEFAKDRFPVYPVYYSNEKYDATEFARDQLAFKILLSVYNGNAEKVIRMLPPHYWEKERISLIKKKCHEYDSEWRAIWGDQFAPPQKVYTVWKPYGIILGLNITEEGKALVLSAADTAGIKKIFQLEISNEDDLAIKRVR